jgi:DNA (cytosine-5)-methyltransferase 1
LSSALRAKRPNGVAIAPPLNAGMGKRRSSGAHGDAMIGMPMVANPLTARMGKGVNTTADEGQTMIPVAVVSADLRNGSVNSEVAQTIQAAGIGAERGGNPNAIPHVLAFDTTQITHPENRSKPDDRFPQLSSSAHPPAIAFDCKAGGNTSFSIGDIPGALRGDGHGGGHAAVVVDVASPLMAQDNRTGGNRSPGMCADSAAGQLVTVFKPSHFTRGKDGAPDDRAPPLSADADKGDQDPVLMHGAAVRRLTPRECERLQGFEDDYTLVKYRGKPMADGPRYRALGNSMNVLDIRAILRRIEEFERIRGAA